MRFNQFNLSQRLLLGPGPSPVYPLVLQALGKPTISHLDPEFIRLMDEVKRLLQYAFQASNELALPLSAPASAGMETCFVNLLEAGDKVIGCENCVEFRSIRLFHNYNDYHSCLIVVGDKAHPCTHNLKTHLLRGS